MSSLPGSRAVASPSFHTSYGLVEFVEIVAEIHYFFQNYSLRHRLSWSVKVLRMLILLSAKSKEHMVLRPRAAGLQVETTFSCKKTFDHALQHYRAKSSRSCGPESLPERVHPPFLKPGIGWS